MANIPVNTPVKVYKNNSMPGAATDRFRFGRLFEALVDSENNLFD